jgi:hypothetical protein
MEGQEFSAYGQSRTGEFGSELTRSCGKPPLFETPYLGVK